MRKQWANVKRIIGAGRPQSQYLTLIDEDGNVLKANAVMAREFKISGKQKDVANFYKIIHPEQVYDLEKTIRNVAIEGGHFNMEVYIKNGTYIPMKWELTQLDTQDLNQKKFLCVGNKLADKKKIDFYRDFEATHGDLIFSNPDAGILLMDASGEFVAANPKLSGLLNVSLEQLYHLHSIEDLWNTTWNTITEKGESLPFEKAPFKKALCTGAAQKETLVVHLEHWGKRWLEFESQPFFEPGHETPFSVISKITDVTTTKKTSEDPGGLDIILKTLIDKSPNPIWVIDERETFVYANQLFYQYYKIGKGKAGDQSKVDSLPGSFSPGLYKKIIHVLNSGIPDDTEEKMALADGTSVNFYINIFQVKTSSGKKMVCGHAIILKNKYQIEKQLREANERLLNFNRAANDAIWEWDMQEGKIFRNEKLMDMIGYTVEDTKGLAWWIRRIHPEDRERVNDKIKKTTDHNEISWEDEYRFKCADGSYKNIHDRGFIIYESGLPVKMIGSLQDVTPLKELKDQLEEERLARQREISETMIRVQEKERRRIGNELHDNVNQILTTTRLFVDMITPANKDEQDIKKKSIEYLLTAIEEIRKLSRELAVPEMKDKSLVEAISKLAKDINTSSTIKIKFIHNNESDLLSPGKKITLYRILQEQIKNILKYSKATEVNVYLDCKSEQAQLIIRDNGIGFDAKQTKTGVGLASIHDRTNFYNGTVNLDTAPGHGCTLTVKLPIL